MPSKSPEGKILIVGTVSENKLNAIKVSRNLAQFQRVLLVTSNGATPKAQSRHLKI